jgi:hypothetical protein
MTTEFVHNACINVQLVHQAQLLTVQHAVDHTEGRLQLVLVSQITTTMAHLLIVFSVQRTVLTVVRHSLAQPVLEVIPH